MENIWIESKTRADAKAKATKVWKAFGFYPRVYRFYGRYIFAVSLAVKQMLRL